MHQVKWKLTLGYVPKLIYVKSSLDEIERRNAILHELHVHVC